MRTRRALLCTLIFLFSGIGLLQAQTAKLRKAKRFMDRLEYAQAIKIYEHINEKEESAVALRNLGIAYRKIHQFAEAESAFGRLTRLEDAQALDFYYHGMTLLHAGSCESAQIVFQEFLDRMPYDERRPYLEDVCRWYHDILEVKRERYQIELPEFNGIASDIAPAFYGDQLVFGSVRQQKKGDGFFYGLYIVDQPELDVLTGRALSYGKVEPFQISSVEEGNEAILSFNEDLSELYLTRNRSSKNIDRELRRLEIAHAKKGADGAWDPLVEMPFNSDLYSVAHPSLSPDGLRLFFSSDMPGGFGGKDLYLSHRLGDEWGPPINLGPVVNTEADELYPFFHESGELYFASDGHFGLGGLDVFQSEDLSLGNWSRPANLGAPINGDKDDFGLILSKDGHSGYFSSNRENGIGQDDIYRFSGRRILFQIVFTGLQESTEQLHFYHNENMIAIPEGGIYQTYVDWDDCGTVQIMQSMYQAQNIEYCARERNGDRVQVEVKLEPNTTVATSTSSPQMLSGKLLNEHTKESLSGVKVSVFINEESIYSVDTDAMGHYSIPVNQEECFRLYYQKDGYFSYLSEQVICPNSVESEQQLEDVYLQAYQEVTEAPIEQEQITEIIPQQETSTKRGASAEEDKAIRFTLNVYYDLGRASVRPEALPELQKLLRLLKENPTLMMEISSHTDTQGPASFNKRLSQRRADAIVRFLVKRGISAKRLLAMGYGETAPVNDCIDHSRCSEEEHQENRRTEFKVIGEIN